jgi:hypothetical protein
MLLKLCTNIFRFPTEYIKKYVKIASQSNISLSPTIMELIQEREKTLTK